MFIIKYKKIFIGVAISLVVLSGLLVNNFGIKKGIDFTGGTVIVIAYDKNTPEINIASFEEKEIKVFKLSENSYKFISQKGYEDVSSIMSSLLNKTTNPYIEKEVNTVGPTMGKEMTKKALIAIILVAVAILAFIAFAFREVSYPVASWKYGVVAMVTIIHDIIVPTGVYSYLSHKYGAEIDTLFIVALLTVMAVTISDKIVVFDRIRENLKNGGAKDNFDQVVGKSLMQTITRSINTSVTVILALIALYYVGPSSTQFFSLTLIVGMIVGTYSSICVASPLLTFLNKGKK